MAKICPITKEKVVYLVCQECEDKPCKNRIDESQAITGFVDAQKVPEYQPSCDYNALLDCFVCAKCKHVQDAYFTKCPECGSVLK